MVFSRSIYKRTLLMLPSKFRGLLGKIMIFVSLSPLAILCLLIALMTFRRDIHTVIVFVGLVLNEFLVSILKVIIAEPRPVGQSYNVLRGEFGMPSSHSQCMFYTATYMTCFTVFRISCTNPEIIFFGLMKLVFIAFWICWALLVCFSRVYLFDHTIEQVAVGLIIGLLFGTLWFFLMQHVLISYFF